MGMEQYWSRTRRRRRALKLVKLICTPHPGEGREEAQQAETQEHVHLALVSHHLVNE